MQVRFVGFGGAHIAGDVLGEEGAPPVILLHGAGQTRHSWAKTAQRLAETGYRAVTYDTRGHGESDWADRYGFDIFQGDLRAVIDTVGGSPALIGASMGGLTALQMLGSDAPPPASALVMVDITTRLSVEGAVAIRAFMTAHPDGFATLDEAADAVSTYLWHRPRPKDVSGLRRSLRERNGRLYWHFDPRFIGGTAPTQSDYETMREQLDASARKVRVPTLIVRGELSEVVQREELEQMRELIPGARVAEVGGARHMVAGDANTSFSDVAIAFLQEVVPVPPIDGTKRK